MANPVARPDVYAKIGDYYYLITGPTTKLLQAYEKTVEEADAAVQRAYCGSGVCTAGYGGIFPTAYFCPKALLTMASVWGLLGGMTICACRDNEKWEEHANKMAASCREAIREQHLEPILQKPADSTIIEIVNLPRPSRCWRWWRSNEVPSRAPNNEALFGDPASEPPPSEEERELQPLVVRDLSDVV